ncbi:MAG TPA: Gfo/Idh/MocA family oxidoreductase [Lacipirellulaceae bacterium]|nr:Gfo/Idh/MocA family oxidoreductase [Lacipirellulaceae bacterium]
MSDLPQAMPSVTLPALPYLPRSPRSYSPGIALVGCGGITKYHLQAYAAAKFRVVALCDVVREAAEARRAEYYPDAAVFTDYRDALALLDVEVVDVTTHPEIRAPIIAECLAAGKHVLSQKPFVLDLDEGERLAGIAEAQGVLLAVNQNARWAPHFSYLREAVKAGLVGQVASMHCGVHWDHSWVRGTAFERVYHLILYDFAIHWFDLLATVMGDQRPSRVFASTVKSPSQDIMPALLGQAAVEYAATQATLVFDGHTRFGALDTVYLSGTHGTVRSFGPSVNRQTVELTREGGSYRPELLGSWFPDGFHGAMGELLCAIEERREPSHNARGNLRSLELCFAAVASALRHEPVVPGSVRKLPDPPLE